MAATSPGRPDWPDPDPLLPKLTRLATRQQRTYQAATGAAALSQIGTLCLMTMSLWQRSQAAQDEERAGQVRDQAAISRPGYWEAPPANSTNSAAGKISVVRGQCRARRAR